MGGLPLSDWRMEMEEEQMGKRVDGKGEGAGRGEGEETGWWVK